MFASRTRYTDNVSVLHNEVNFRSIFSWKMQNQTEKTRDRQRERERVCVYLTATRIIGSSWLKNLMASVYRGNSFVVCGPQLALSRGDEKQTVPD
jgi:hypothetical protein